MINKKYASCIWKKLQSKKSPTIQIVEVIPSKDQIDKALKIHLSHKKSLRGSITKGKGEFIGILGEILAADWYGLPLINNEEKWNPDFDLVHPTLGKVDVKSKRQNVAYVYSDYECSIWAQSKTRQKCDTYLFTRIKLSVAEEKNNNFNECKAWLLGWLPKQVYFDSARFLKRGEVDPKSSNDFQVQDDCYNLPIYQLNPINAQ